MSWDVRETDTCLRGDNGIYLTQGLFREFGSDCGPYTMHAESKEINGKLYISAYEIYMDSVNEYEAAMRLFGSMDHWRKLTNIDWFMNGVEIGGRRITSGLKHWREDHQMKREAEALGALRVASRSGNVQASRYLHELSSKKPTSRKSKSEAVSEEDLLIKDRLKSLRRVK